MGTLKGRIRGRLTYANVVSTVCLFVLLGGTAVAVDGSLPGQNTVGSADIIDAEVYSQDVRNNQIRTRDVRDDSLTGGGLIGDDIDESSLGQVPSAVNAATLDGNDSADFASSGDVHAPSRVAVDDPTTGDNDAATVTLVDNGAVQVEAVCVDNLGATNSDIAEISVSLTNSSLTYFATNGPSGKFPGGSGAQNVLTFFEPDAANANTVESAYFITVPDAGSALGGFVSAELNDQDGGGSDCTFGASLVG